MRAVTFAGFGEQPSLNDVPALRVVEPDEVLVRVRAASLNRFDAMVSIGALQGMLEYQFPVTLGRDFSGIVEGVGPSVTRFEVGDEVFGMVGKMVLGDGSFADQVVVSQDYLAAKPAGIDFTQAAALPLAGTAAVLAVDWVDAGEGKVVLIVGATGGVGNYAVQLAAARGATVIATGLPEDEQHLRDLGADEVVDYRGDVAGSVMERHPGGVDGLIDLASDAAGLAVLADVVHDGGRIASALLAADVDGLAARGIAATNLAAYPNAEILAALSAQVEEGTLRVPIRDVYPLGECTRGLDRFLSGSVRGKMAVSFD